MGRLNPLPFRLVKRRLESVGFREYSERGSHVKFVRQTGEIVDTVIVPKHGEIAVGTPRSILNQSHISLDEWEGHA